MTMEINEPNFVTQKQLDWVNDFMANALEVTPDEEAREFLIITIGLSTRQATKVMAYKQEFLTNPGFQLSLLKLS